MKPTAYSNFACVIVISLFGAGCISFKEDRNVYRENGFEIVTQERTSLLPHGSGGVVLKVAGHSFHNLISPSYVFIPEWNSIIFLTHRDGGAYILHIFSLEKKHDIAIKQKQDDFDVGSGLGFPKTNHSACYVEKVEGDTVILVDGAFGGMDYAFEDTYQLDRSKKTLSHLEKRKRVENPK